MLHKVQPISINEDSTESTWGKHKLKAVRCSSCEGCFFGATKNGKRFRYIKQIECFRTCMTSFNKDLKHTIQWREDDDQG